MKKHKLTILILLVIMIMGLGWYGRSRTDWGPRLTEEQILFNYLGKSQYDVIDRLGQPSRTEYTPTVDSEVYYFRPDVGMSFTIHDARILRVVYSIRDSYEERSELRKKILNTYARDMDWQVTKEKIYAGIPKESLLKLADGSVQVYEDKVNIFICGTKLY